MFIPNNEYKIKFMAIQTNSIFLGKQPLYVLSTKICQPDCCEDEAMRYENDAIRNKKESGEFK